MRTVLRDRRVLQLTLIAAALVVVSFLFYLAMGSVSLPIQTVVRELIRGDSGGIDNSILWRIRIPRALAAASVGAILATSGTVCQALFRNALAEPYVIGVSSGAAVGGTTAILLGVEVGYGRVGFASAGALLSLWLVTLIAKRQGVINTQTLLLGGVVVGSMLAGLTTLNLTLAGLDSGKVLWWLLGSTTPMFQDRVVLLVMVSISGFVVLFLQGRLLNALSVSEFMAERQGVNTKRLKAVTLVTCAAMTGVAVGLVGVIGFVGLVAPHIARRIFGSDLRKTLPISAILGAGLLLIADILAQRLRPGTELPIGAVTAVLGAPVLLWMLKQRG